jgi:uncharacterized membrane protein
VTAGVLAGLVPLLTGTVVVEAVLNHQRADGRTGLALTLMLWVIAAVGLVVAWHQPRNAIGWLMLGAPVILLLTLASQTYVHHAYRAGQHALPVLGPVALVERRQQLKWLMTGAAACGAFLIASVATNSSLWAVLRRRRAAALPVSIGVGILKYRLYDIDRLISRTLAYALVTGLLLAVYAGLVLLATQVLGFASTWAVAASTLAAAALFTPLRRRLQWLVDRRFNPARYDADRMVDAFASRLQDAVDLDTVRADLAAVVRGALEPAQVSVWISGGGP